MFRTLHDRQELAALFAPNPALHLYSLGDLDDAFWPRTTWYSDGAEVVLVYAAPEIPVVLAFTERPEAMRALLAEVEPFLPRRFYSHLSPGLADVLRAHWADEFHGHYQRMVLADREPAGRVDTGACVALGPADAKEALAFYAAAYPGNWFDPRMLETGRYFGIRENEALVAVAGVHVFSRTYRVAALGNISVHESHRRRGLGLQVTARACRSLLADCDVIGLNVRRDNAPAIRCYEKLGFRLVAPYDEHMFSQEGS